MDVREVFLWSPLIGIALGVLAGLGSLRSGRFACASGGLALLLQAIGWPILFVVAEVLEKGGQDWQIALGVGFLRGLLVAFPYTVIGAVGSGVLVGLIRRFTKRQQT